MLAIKEYLQSYFINSNITSGKMIQERSEETTTNEHIQHV